MHWTSQHIRAMAERMERRRTGFAVSAETAPLIVKALKFYAREGCVDSLRDNSFTIDAWDDAGLAIVDHVGLVRSFDVMEDVYAATLLRRPGKLIIVRHGIRMILASSNVIKMDRGYRK